MWAVPLLLLSAVPADDGCQPEPPAPARSLAFDPEDVGRTADWLAAATQAARDDPRHPLALANAPALGKAIGIPAVRLKKVSWRFRVKEVRVEGVSVDLPPRFGFGKPFRALFYFQIPGGGGQRMAPYVHVGDAALLKSLRAGDVVAVDARVGEIRALRPFDWDMLIFLENPTLRPAR